MPDRAVGIAQLKARLSEYLRGVRRGRAVTIYDRAEPVARLVPIDAAEGRLVVRDPVTRHRNFGHIALPAAPVPVVDGVELFLEERRRNR